ncbi:MAG: hypothetical protein LBD49_01805 [Oscillospiraceae bacterium]|jgi:hypothetical protein|nr:hypothetical protein [Oscillospiraceae bacterium]
MNKKGTSSVPLITGIIGAILMLPALACVSCASAVAGAGGAKGAAIIGMIIGLLPIGLGIAGGTKGKSSPTLSMALLLFAAILALIGWILTAFTSLMHLAAFILFLIGGIVAKTQKTEE